MKEVVLNKKKVVLYDDIEDMPIANFQKYNKYLLIDSGIGSDSNDIDSHISKIAKFIKNDDKGKALQELQNMRQNIYMINSHISPKYMAFAALIKSIDGKEVANLSDDNLKAILKELQAVKHSVIAKMLQAIKKKVSEELELYFPGDFGNPKANVIYNRQKEKALLMLDSIITGRNHDEEEQRLDDAIFRMYYPKNFIGKSSVEITYDKQFEETRLMLSQEGHIADVRAMTVLQFYSAVGAIKKQAELKSKLYKKHKIKKR